MAKLITPVFRASFVHLVEPKAPAPEAEPVYSMAIVLPKDDKDTKAFMKKLKTACDATAKDKLGKLPKKLKRPWKDGDEEDRPEWEGAWVLSAKSKSRPGVVGKDLQPIMESELLYSGAYYRVSVSPWAWTHSVGGQGVSLNLDNVMWVKDGEPFSARSAAEEDFAEYEEADDLDDDDQAESDHADDEDDDIDFS